jgi:hypothetical protein
MGIELRVLSLLGRYLPHEPHPSDELLRGVMKYTLELKLTEQSLHATAKVNLTNVILSEGRRTEEHLQYDFIYNCGV